MSSPVGQKNISVNVAENYNALILNDTCLLQALSRRFTLEKIFGRVYLGYIQKVNQALDRIEHKVTTYGSYGRSFPSVKDNLAINKLVAEVRKHLMEKVKVIPSAEQSITNPPVITNPHKFFIASDFIKQRIVSSKSNELHKHYYHLKDNQVPLLYALHLTEVGNIGTRYIDFMNSRGCYLLPLIVEFDALNGLVRIPNADEQKAFYRSEHIESDFILSMPGEVFGIEPYLEEMPECSEDVDQSQDDSKSDLVSLNGPASDEIQKYNQRLKDDMIKNVKDQRLKNIMDDFFILCLKK